jgi:hypothetical protein
MTLFDGQYPALQSDALQPAASSAIVPVTPEFPERLYALLPAIYRLRDAAQGEQLRALLAIIESELRSIEGDMEALYENWFIETCEEWVVPYIGDLLAVRDLNAASPRTFGQERRAYVANTLFYRQRKGTTPVLEQLARDITGWGARAVESLQLVATTQNINHLRPQAQSILLRPPRTTEQLIASSEPEVNLALDRLGTPFETAAYTTQIRPSRGDRSRYNPASVALYLWQLQPYLIEVATPRAVIGLDAESQGYGFIFNPLGDEQIPLFNLPQTETELTTLAQEENLPGVLTRDLLSTLLQKNDSAIVPVQVRINDQPQPFQVVDLSQWQSAAPLAIDPERGRLLFRADQLQFDQPPQSVTVTYVEAFSGDVGAGTYERPGAITEQPPVPGQLTWQVRSLQPDSLAEAVKTWNQYARKWQRCYDLVNFPVARLAVTPDGIQQVDRNETELPKMQAGILRGLQAIAQPGEIDLVITPGVAIDRQGQAIRLNVRHCVVVGCYPRQTVLLTIDHLSWRPYWKIRAIPQQNGQYTRSTTEIPLVELMIDADGRIEQIRNGVRAAFQPGFVGSFQISILSSSNSTGFSLSPSPDAFAVNRNGQKIRLDRVTAYSLPPEPAPPQTMLLFIAPSQPAETGRLDIVPDTDRAIIELQGNRTLTRNLALQIPAEKRLYLVASNGDRPHLIGNLTVRGMATPDTENGGDFFLEGLLVEGGLTVLPGNLQRLQIAHSTLVPTMGGLVAKKAEYEIADEYSDDVMLLALLMYGLTLLRRLLQVGLANSELTTLERITQLAQIAQQQIITLFEGIRYVWRRSPYQPPQNQSEDDEDVIPGCTLCQLSESDNAESVNLDEDNSFLEVRINRSICGAIALADTVPTLSITESIIGSRDVQTFAPAAIAVEAMGADVDVQKSTLFGTVHAHRLEAETSIFGDQVTVLRRQVGCLRFCYVPAGSQTPRRYRCQPDLLLSEQVGEMPAGIATLTVHPHTGQIFAGTTGGIWRFFEASKQWVPLNAGLDPLNVTALLAIASSGKGSLTGDRGSTILAGNNTHWTQEVQAGDRIFALDQSFLILEVISDRALRLSQALTLDLPTGTPFSIDTLLAGTTDGKLLQATPVLKTGMGTLNSMGLQANGRIAVTGCGTHFAAEWVGGKLTVGNQTRPIASVESPTLLTLETAFEQNILTDEYLIATAIATVGGVATNPDHSTVSSTSDRALVIGCRTRFRQDIQIGDEILVLDRVFDREAIVLETRMVTAILSDTVLRVNAAFTENWTTQPFLIRRTEILPATAPATSSPALSTVINTQVNAVIQYQKLGAGTIISTGETMTGQNTQFTQEFAIGDAIAIKTAPGELTQTRKVVEITSDTQLKIHAPFDTDLTQQTTYTVTGILAATSGNGMVRSTNGGKQWSAQNQGLTNLDVRSIAHDPDTGYLFAGTQGSGIFRSGDGGLTWTGGDPIDPEIRQTGLTTPLISSFAINPLNHDLFVGTVGGGVFRSSDAGDRWMPMNQGLQHSTITALSGFTQAGTGTLSSRYTSVSGRGTRFQAELQVGDTLTLNGQTRTITHISTHEHIDQNPDETIEHLTLNDAFDPDLAEGTAFERFTLLAGTSDGTIYRSTSNGKIWQPIARLTHTGISAFAVQQQSAPVLFAGTQLGSLYQAEATDRQGDRWSAINTGIPGIEATWLIVNQMQPRFTSERYGQPTYAQLSTICPIEIRTGTEDGSEMGVFHFLKQPQREANLQASLKEYLRFGLQADILYVSDSLADLNGSESTQ